MEFFFFSFSNCIHIFRKVIHSHQLINTANLTRRRGGRECSKASVENWIWGRMFENVGTVETRRGSFIHGKKKLCRCWLELQNDKKWTQCNKKWTCSKEGRSICVKVPLTLIINHVSGHYRVMCRTCRLCMCHAAVGDTSKTLSF